MPTSRSLARCPCARLARLPPRAQLGLRLGPCAARRPAGPVLEQQRLSRSSCSPDAPCPRQPPKVGRRRRRGATKKAAASARARARSTAARARSARARAARRPRGHARGAHPGLGRRAKLRSETGGVGHSIAASLAPTSLIPSEVIDGAACGHHGRAAAPRRRVAPPARAPPAPPSPSPRPPAARPPEPPPPPLRLLREERGGLVHRALCDVHVRVHRLRWRRRRRRRAAEERHRRRRRRRRRATTTRVGLGRRRRWRLGDAVGVARCPRAIRPECELGWRRGEAWPSRWRARPRRRHRRYMREAAPRRLTPRPIRRATPPRQTRVAAGPAAAVKRCATPASASIPIAAADAGVALTLSTAASNTHHARRDGRRAREACGRCSPLSASVRRRGACGARPSRSLWP